MKEEKKKWIEDEFYRIHSAIERKECLSLDDFLRIRNFKIQNASFETEEHVSKVTTEAFCLAEQGDIKKSIDKLCELDGVRIPIASAILAMKYPEKYAIIDWRVISELGKKEWLDYYVQDSEIYSEYIKLLHKTKPENMSLRDYEFSLFKKSKEKDNQIL